MLLQLPFGMCVLTDDAQGSKNVSRRDLGSKQREDLAQNADTTQKCMLAMIHLNKLDRILWMLEGTH
jgi:hypothetical protein